MSFDNTLLPLIPRSISPAERWSDSIIEAGGGAETRQSWWADSLKAWEVEFAAAITLAQFQQLRNHFNGRRGRVRSFPFLDYTDYTASADAFGTGDGSTTAFQLKVARGDSGNAYAREIYKPKSGTVTIFDNASTVSPANYSINYSTGVVTFTVAPVDTHALTWTGEYYIPARWDMTASELGSLFVFVSGGTQLAQTAPARFVETRDYS